MELFSGETLLSAVFALGGSALAWLLADAKSKSRLSYMEESVSEISEDAKKNSKQNQDRINKLEIELARCDQNRLELHKGLERLDSSKASREVVDGIRTDINTLRLDMDKRFDKLERLIEGRN